MKLERLVLTNFRQFYGTVELDFATDNSAITVLIGDNGAGKTSLLNAFTWALFGQTSPAFQDPELIVNLRALRELPQDQDAKAAVELTFEHEGNKYTITRTASAHLSEQGYQPTDSPKPTLVVTGPGGTHNDIDRIADAIGHIMPADLHSYFFFDGERIEKIVRPDNAQRKEIAAAAKTLAGIEIFDRAIKHLTSARRTLEKEMAEVGTAQVQNLVAEKQKHEQTIANLEEDERKAKKNLDIAETQRNEIDKKLRGLEATRALQEQRDKLNQQIDDLTQKFKKLDSDLGQLFSTAAYSPLLTDAVSTFGGIVSDLKTKGELPAGIKTNFVQELLNKELCICETSLAPDSRPRASVENWVARAGLADVEENVLRMDGAFESIAQRAEDFYQGLKSLQAEKSETRKQLSIAETDRDNISKKLTGSGSADIAALENQRSKFERDISTLHIDTGKRQQSRIDIEKTIAELEKRIARAQTQDKQQALAKKRVEMTNDAIQRIATIQRIVERGFQVTLSQEISALFNKMSPTPYVPELGEDYSLRLLNSAGGEPIPVAASTGENQILSLGFIGTIIETAREQQKRLTMIPSLGVSEYPIVMDSPFGSLGDIYREAIATNIPEMANQLILMVSKTQWLGKVESVIERKIGKCYVLTYFSPKDDIETDSIELENRTYDLIKKSPNDYEYTEISEVQYG